MNLLDLLLKAKCKYPLKIERQSNIFSLQIVAPISCQPVAPRLSFSEESVSCALHPKFNNADWQDNGLVRLQELIADKAIIRIEGQYVYLLSFQGRVEIPYACLNLKTGQYACLQ